MKKFLLCSLFSTLFLLSVNQANAGSMVNAGYVTGGYTYADLGGIYTNTTFPVDVGQNTENKEIDLTKLKKGESTSHNILMLVETGDAGVDEAAKKAGITKIHYVDTKIQKVYIPLGFIPIYVKERKTIVYGE